MQAKSIRFVWILAVFATIVTVGFYSLRAQAHTVSPGQGVSVAPTIHPLTSCAEVGAWCADAERAARARIDAASHSPTPIVQLSCGTVGAWCSDMQQQVRKRLQQHG